MDLRSVRKSRGLSQAQFAREVGLKSKGFVSGLESGSRKTTIETALRIEQFFGVAGLAHQLLPPKKAALLVGHFERRRA